MPEDFSQHYALTKALEQEPKIIPCPPLYPEDDEKIYAATMDRLAQPLPTGETSPFSAQTPGSAHSLLTGTIVHLQGLVGHELNLLPDRVWVMLYRMLGIELQNAEYPVVNLYFKRAASALEANIPVAIPAATEVRSNLDDTIAAYTLYPAIIEGSAESVQVPARLNRVGALPNVRVGEFSVLPRLLSHVESVANDGIALNQGRTQETLPEAMVRARDQFKTGMRCVTPRDYYIQAMALGPEKVNVLTNIQPGIAGQFADLVTVVVYPPSISNQVEQGIIGMTLGDARLLVMGAEIIPLDGLIEIRVVNSLTDAEAWNLAAAAIASSVNPPFGLWGDLNFTNTIATALELVNGIFAAPTINLKHSITDVPLADLDIAPWQLLEVQSTIQISISR